MELRQLEYFIAVAEESHFTRAARRLHVAQSGLSATIRALEKELGAPLFRRSTRQVRLTGAGEALLVEARRTVAAAGAGRAAVAAVQGLVRGRLALGSLQCLHSLHLPALLHDFVTAYPGVDVRLQHGGSTELIEHVRTGRLDLAFVAKPARCPDELRMTPLGTEALVLACAPDHPLAGRASVGLTELAPDRFVDFHPGWGTRDLADTVLAEAGVHRKVPLEVTDVHSLLELVSFGLGVALVPENFSHKTAEARFIPLSGEVPAWETVSVTTEAPSAATAALRERIGDHSA
ncbi:LysR family transcriptional regulator [Amycolatopsis magusensis]|uniref:LysR family transcriptional regulator n=1 Tax=Amycolatopsis magusensis TaxID=882444 RepID=UPI003C2AE33F